MNSVATATGGAAAFLGASFMLVPRWLFGAGDTGAAAIIFIVALPVALALLLSVRFPPHILGPHESKRAIHGSVVYAVATGWLHGDPDGGAVPTVAATLSGLAAHRMVFGINTLLVLVMVRHSDTEAVAGLGLPSAALFFAATGLGSFLATACDTGPRASVGPLRRAQRRAGIRGGRPAVRLGPPASCDDAVRIFCSARLGRWSSCAPTPRCRSTSTTPCAGTCSPSRTRCSGCRSSSRWHWRRR